MSPTTLSLLRSREAVDAHHFIRSAWVHHHGGDEAQLPSPGITRTHRLAAPMPPAQVGDGAGVGSAFSYRSGAPTMGIEDSYPCQRALLLRPLGRPKRSCRS